MSKIQFEYEGKTYTLEYDRDTVSAAEQLLGISIEDIRDGRLSIFPKLFRAAFLKHHQSTRSDVIEEIFDKMPNRKQLFEELISMYATTLNTLLEEPPRGKAIGWTTI